MDFNFDDIKTNQLKIAKKLMETNEFLDAEEIFRQFPDEIESKMGLSLICFNAGKYDKSLEYLEGLDNLESWVARATLFKEDNDEKLEECLWKIYEKSEGEMWKLIADFLKDKERWAEMIPILSKNKTEVAAMMLADVYVHQSELSMARNLLRKILQENKNNFVALMELCSIAHKKEDFPENTESEIYRFLEMDAIPKQAEATLRNALGKFFEKNSKMELATSEYLKFMELELQNINPDVFENRLTVKDVAKKYNKELIQNVPSSSADCPLVFVLGMPRSGTTLIESTLIAHSEVDTYGETVGISMMIDDLVKGKCKPANPDEALEYYMDGKPEKQSKLIIDKMPGNFHYIGAIYQMFPKAKFIYSKRDALDNSVGCLTTQFKQGHPYSYDIKQMALEYQNHLNFMELWEEILPEGTILTVNYEDMVEDHEGQTQRILEYLGLEFEESCLRFHEIKRDVKTASLAQVVNPIYRTSLSRGEKFIINSEFAKLKDYLTMEYSELEKV